MATKPKRPKPFDVELPDTLATELCQDITNAFDMRSSVVGDGGLIDLADFYYEQGRSDPKDRPFVGAADLTSYFIYEKVSALRARLMKAVFGVRPFCFVEGWGQDASKAPYVEEFHDWQTRKGDLPLELYKTIHGALLEDAYILEVSERIETRRTVEELDVALELHPDTQGPILENGQPKIQMDADGEPVPATDGQASAKIKRDYVKTKRLGPQYDAISMKDFVFLPGHAKNQKQVYGYAYRVFARVPELQEKAKDGVYDQKAVDLVGEAHDRENAAVPPVVDGVASQDHPAIVEVELMQVALKRDLDDDGREEWYVLTVHVPSSTILRCKLDTFVMRVGIPRCVPFVLFPRRNSVYGYSFAFDALLTLAEEHTSLRNMKADRGALATQAPLKILQGALYDPEAQPMGVGRAIYVREMNEVQPMQIPDVPNSAVQQTIEQVQAVERVSGLGDNAVGVQSLEARTLGEQRLVAGGTAVRVDEVMGHLHWAISQVMQLSNAIWVDTLEVDGKGIDAPSSVVATLQSRGADFDGKFTVSMLKGNFQFEPYGSDATADPQRQRGDFNSGLMALGELAKTVTSLQPILADRAVGQTILEQWARVYNIRDRQPFLKAFKNQPPMPVTATPTGGPAPMAGTPDGLPPALAALLPQAGAPNV